MSLTSELARPGTSSDGAPTPVPRGPRLPSGPPLSRTVTAADLAWLSALTDDDEATRTPCATQDEDLWFAASPADVEAAKELCRPCPAREACLQGALSRAEPWGVWGGQLLEDGVVVARKRPRGRPPRALSA